MSSTHGWIDGVPLELRPRYYPKPPLRFKDIDIYIPLDAIENDYDFTEERRVLIECKMWEEEREKRRLQEAEEERIRIEEEKLRMEEEKLRMEEEERRLQEEKCKLEMLKLEEKLKLEERLKLEEEEREREEIQRLEKEASLDQSSELDTSLSEEEKKDESPISQPQHILLHSTETETVPVSLPHIQHQQTTNGYNYMMSDMQMPMMYQQTGQNYFNYFAPPPLPQPVAPIAPMLTVGQQHTLPQSSAIPPVLQYQSATVGSTGGDSNVLQSHYVQSTPAGSHNVPLPTTTNTTVGCDTTPEAHPVLQYQSATNVGASGGNSSGHSGSALQSHFVQPTQAGTQVPLPTTTATLGCDRTEADVNCTDNSFTKLHFPFLTSMAASSRSSRERDNGLGYLSSNFSHSYQPSNTPQSDEIASQNPFLSSYVQSRSPMQRQQYWPTSHLPPQLSPHQHQSQNPYSAHATVTPVQNGPVQSVIGASNNFIATSGPSTAPPTGSQHVLR